MSYEERRFDYIHPNCSEYVVEVEDKTREITVKIRSASDNNNYEFVAKFNSCYEEEQRGSKIITRRKMIVNELHFPDDDIVTTYSKLIRAVIRKNSTPAWAKQALRSTIESLENVLNIQSINSEA